MLRFIFVLVMVFSFSSMSLSKTFDKKKCEEILKKYDVSYQSWNNILNKLMSERKKIEDKKKANSENKDIIKQLNSNINRLYNEFGSAMRVHEIRMNTFANSYNAFCK